MTNDVLYKKSVPNIVIIVVLSVFFVWGTISFIQSRYYRARYNKTVSELGSVREELESAHNRESELEELIREYTGTVGSIREITDRAVEYADKTENLLLSTGTTIAEIRKQCENLAEYSNNLYWYIISIRNNTISNKCD
jgi:hypothetical protein